MRYLLGGYSADAGGSATGIGLLTAGSADSPLASGPLGFGGNVAAAVSPSWLAWHPSLEVVYAALETRGAVQAYRRTGETSFAPLGGPVRVGDSPCHVLALSQALIVCNYGDGRVVRVALAADGRPGAAKAWTDAAAPANDEPVLDLASAARALRDAAGEEYAHLIPDVPEPDAAVAEAQEGPVSRAHHATALPGGLVATTDLGLDLVRIWRAGREWQRVQLPGGSGPRHAVWHPSGHLYVVTEASNEIFALAPDATDTWRLVTGVALGGMPTDAAAELALSHDREVLYAALRGSDTIAAVRIRGAGETLAPVALAEAGVTWPRHHIVARDSLLVAGQQSDEVASLSLDVRTGAPGRVRYRTTAPAPSVIVPL
ncbi:lactonase family protein [Microbacterium marinum]|uniref:lactonase family protein n=1 Tax=Microbacterium marinum TaxID=421115 RepID=UPI00384D552E